MGGFLAQSYLGSRTSSQDVSAFYLSQIYQLQANSISNDSNGVPLPPLPTPPKPAPVPTVAHLLWFPSLVLSLVAAVFATLVQEWVRKYLLLTQPRFSPHRRARIRACMEQDGSLALLQRTVHTLHTFLHLSIFFFFLGLIALTASDEALIIVAVNVYIFVPLILYLRYSLLPYFHPHSLYSTPLSGFFLYFKGVPQIGRSLLRAIMGGGRFRDAFRGYNTPVEGGWLTLDYAILEVEKLAEARSSTLDIGAVSWLLNSLGEDQELEQFLAGIPGFYRSKHVEDPAQTFRMLNTDRLPRAIVSFMDRSLSSELVSDVVGQKRIRVSVRAIGTDPYLLRRTFHHALCSPESAVFKCVDFVLLADRCTNDDDPDVCFLAKCIVAVAISRLDSNPAPDARWSGIVQRGLNWSEPELFDHCYDHDGIPLSSSWDSSVKLRNLLQIARELHTAHPDYYDDPSFRTIFHNTLLSAVRRLDAGSASQELRREFCTLWNQLVGSMQDVRQDPALRSNAMRVLSIMRPLYDTLHEGTESRCVAYLASSDDPELSPQKATAYPFCAHSPHRLTRAPHEGNVTVNYDT